MNGIKMISILKPFESLKVISFIFTTSMGFSVNFTAEKITPEEQLFIIEESPTPKQDSTPDLEVRLKKLEEALSNLQQDVRKNRQYIKIITDTLEEDVEIIKMFSPTSPVNKENPYFNWFVYQQIPCHEGLWTLYNKQSLEGKRVALVVHGHNQESIINDYATAIKRDLKIPQFIASNIKKRMIPASYNYYGLGVLIHLARILSEETFISDEKGVRPRYDIVLGLARTTSGTLKEDGRRFSEQVHDFLLKANPGKVDLIAHSMAGLTTRWGLEKEGLGHSIKDCIFSGGPHQGVPALPTASHLVPEDFLTTCDMLTVNKNFSDATSLFLNELNTGDITYNSNTQAWRTPFSEDIRYHTIVATDASTLTASNPQEFAKDKSKPTNAGKLIQLYFEAFKNTRVDGLVPDYSARGEDILSYKSDFYSENMRKKIGEKDFCTVDLKLNHRSMTGNSQNLHRRYPEIAYKYNEQGELSWYQVNKFINSDNKLVTEYLPYIPTPHQQVKTVMNEMMKDWPEYWPEGWLDRKPLLLNQ